MYDGSRLWPPVHDQAYNKWAQFKRENARGDEKVQLVHNLITFVRHFLTQTPLEGARRDMAVVAILERFVIEYRI